MLKANLLKYLDPLAGRLLAGVLPCQQPRAVHNIRNILVIRPGGIGDAVLLLPALAMLAESVPAAKIEVLAECRNAEVFYLCPHVSTVWHYDSLPELMGVMSKRFDVVIDTEQWYRLSAVVTRLIRAPMKIGFDTNVRRRMFTHCIMYNYDLYEPDNFVALLEPLGVSDQRDLGAETLMLAPQVMSVARQLLQPIDTDPFVVIFPGASIEEKRWGAEHFSQVAYRLTQEGWRVVTVGGREDRADGDRIVGDMGINLSGKTTLAETAAVIARSSLVISGDSGVLHLAAGLDIPTVSLFGPSSVAKWAPQGKRHIVLNNHLTCSPCTKFGTAPPCPINARCMRDISSDDVMEAIERLLPPLPKKI